MAFGEDDMAADIIPANLTTPVGLVRLLIPDLELLADLHDTDIKTFMLSDDAINALLGLNGGVPRLAAADACEIIGTDDLLIGKVITTSDLMTDASKVAAQMYARAKSLRTQAAAAGQVPTIDTAEDDLIITPGPGCYGWPELVPYYGPLG